MWQTKSHQSLNAVKYLHKIWQCGISWERSEKQRYAELTDPRESDTADGIREHIGEYWRVRVACWEVRVKPRMLPVCYLQPHTAQTYPDDNHNKYNNQNNLSPRGGKLSTPVFLTVISLNQMSWRFGALLNLKLTNSMINAVHHCVLNSCNKR